MSRGSCVLLDRLTLVGWVLLVANALMLSLLGPGLLAQCSPDLLRFLAQRGRLMALVFVAALTVCFAASALLLHALGVRVIRRTVSQGPGDTFASPSLGSKND